VAFKIFYEHPELLIQTQDSFEIQNCYYSVDRENLNQNNIEQLIQGIKDGYSQTP